jgi:4-hydroxythreonine-4-phosphate dehydrogenase
MKKIAITFGDPNGISPEITIKALNFLDLPKDKVILITNKNILNYYNEKYSLSLEKDYEIIEVPYNYEDIMPGKETEAAGEFAFRSIVQACNLAVNKQIEAIVTAPVCKNAMKLAGHNYSGQTEILELYIAQENQKADMLFVCENFSVLLLTRHIALKDVPLAVTKENIINKIENLENSMHIQMGLADPKIAICGLNPHCGENGMFGEEEINEIIPAIKELRLRGINIEGPFPADALFTNCASGKCNYDCYVAIYHDQGLIPVKMLDRNNCVNTTIGLNVLRTSPAHGTAFDIAGENIANAESMINAIKLAVNDFT